MSRWRIVDVWDESDPALTAMRDLLALGTAQDAPERPEPSEVSPKSTIAPAAPLEESKRERIAELVGRVQSGDLSAIDALRKILAR